MKLYNNLKSGIIVCSLLLLNACNTIDTNKTFKVDFNLKTPNGLTTTEHNSQFVKFNELVEKPVVTVIGDNEDNYRIEGWYTTTTYEDDSLWDFDIYRVKNDLSLYAKWTKMYSVKFFLEGNDTPVYETLVKPNHTVNNCDDKVAGYKIDGYYTSNKYLDNEVYNFDSPVNNHLSLYLKTDGLIYFSASTLKRNFSPVAASISGSTVGSTTLIKTNDEEALQVNFGYSAKASNGNSDPHILFAGGNISTLKSQVVSIKMKNYGAAKQIGFYYVGKDNFNNYVGGDDFTAANCLYYTFKSNEMNMNENDEWITIDFNLAADSPNWTKISTLNKIRIESTYASKDSKDTSNIFIIKEITSKNVASYDTRNPLISFYNNEQLVYKTRINKGDILTKEDAINMCSGYKIKNFYSDSNKTILYNFENNISNNVDIFIDYEDTFYFTGKGIASRFLSVASNDNNTKDFSPTKGSINYNEAYDGADINFGLSVVADPYIYINDCYILVNDKKYIDVTFKNLGNCKQLAFYWAGITKQGNEIKDFQANYEYWSTANLISNMKIEDDYVTYTFDLSANNYWVNMKAITKFRIQAAYVSTSKSDLSNRMIIASISGR